MKKRVKEQKKFVIELNNAKKLMHRKKRGIESYCYKL